eukprot:GSMAST32.ASY1.ANO1.1268.1 assembled CDS
MFYFFFFFEFRIYFFFRTKFYFFEIHGSTPSAKRIDLVNSFNNENNNYFVFLLSSKAGGVGLNLIGANRLFLYDIDWNPATDAQAMARSGDTVKRKMFQFIGYYVQELSKRKYFNDNYQKLSSLML